MTIPNDALAAMRDDPRWGTTCADQGLYPRDDETLWEWAARRQRDTRAFGGLYAGDGPRRNHDQRRAMRSKRKKART